MPWIDARGIVHVSETDLLSPPNQHHIITCPTCSNRYPHVTQRILQNLRENAVTVQPTETTPVKPVYILDHSDRCDKCGARAYVQTVIAAGGSLYWCHHHWMENRRKLEAVSLHILDETSALFEHVKDDGHVTPGKEVSLPPRKTFG